MSEIIEKLSNAVVHLEDVCRDIDYFLSIDYQKYNVEINGEKFSFDKPTTLEEKAEFDAKKRRLITILLEDYFKNLIPHLIKYYADDTYKDDAEEPEWAANKIDEEFKIGKNLSLFEDMVVPEENIISEIATEEYDKARKIIESGEKKSVMLDLESTYVNMERPDWNEEKYEELIRRKTEES